MACFLEDNCTGLERFPELLHGAKQLMIDNWIPADV